MFNYFNCGYLPLRKSFACGRLRQEWNRLFIELDDFGDTFYTFDIVNSFRVAPVPGCYFRCWWAAHTAAVTRQVMSAMTGEWTTIRWQFCCVNVIFKTRSVLGITYLRNVTLKQSNAVARVTETNSPNCFELVLNDIYPCFQGNEIFLV